MTKFMANQKIKWISISILISIFQSILKFYAFYITKSSSVFTDAVESLANVGASLFALYAVYLSQQPKDENHLYGHGKIEYFSSGFEGGLILISGVFVLIESIRNEILNKEPENLETGIILIAISTVINFYYGIILQKNGKKLNSLALIADGKHLFSDSISSISIILGLVIIKLTHFNQIDVILSVLLSIYLIYSGFGLIKKSVAGLMDQTDEELYTVFAQKLNLVRKENWIDVHNFRIIQYGSSFHIDCHLTLPYYLSLEESHEEVGRFEKELIAITNQETEIFTHTDPCLPQCCFYCKIAKCTRRNEPFVSVHEWTNKNLQKNEKHFV